MSESVSARAWHVIADKVERGSLTAPEALQKLFKRVSAPSGVGASPPPGPRANITTILSEVPKRAPKWGSFEGYLRGVRGSLEAPAALQRLFRGARGSLAAPRLSRDSLNGARGSLRAPEAL